MQIKKVFLVAGGTGGHVFPAIATALHLLNKKSYSINLIFDKRAYTKYSQQIKDQALVHQIMVTGLHKKNPLFLFKIFILLGIGFIQSLFLLLKYKCSIIISFGGYTSVPVGFAVIFINFFRKILRQEKIILFIHEQNTVMGKSNRVLSKYADKILLTFEKTSGIKDSYNNKIIAVGLPIRDDFYSFTNSNKQITNKDKTYDNKVRMLILGGSLGSKIFSYNIPQAFTKIESNQQERFIIYHQCREEYLTQVDDMWLKTEAEVHIKPFFHNIAEIMKSVDVIITRAGASTIKEINTLGKYAIYVPLKTSTDNHQYYNALAAVDNNAATLINEDDFNDQNLVNCINNLLINDYLYKKCSKSFALRDTSNSTYEIEKELNAL